MADAMTIVGAKSDVNELAGSLNCSKSVFEMFPLSLWERGRG
jgi:hypothetical protein